VYNPPSFNGMTTLVITPTGVVVAIAMSTGTIHYGYLVDMCFPVQHPALLMIRPLALQQHCGGVCVWRAVLEVILIVFTTNPLVALY